MLDYPVLGDISARADRSARLSYFVTLAPPESGGELYVYALRSDEEIGKAFTCLDPRSEEARRIIAP